MHPSCQPQAHTQQLCNTLLMIRCLTGVSLPGDDPKARLAPILTRLQVRHHLSCFRLLGQIESRRGRFKIAKDSHTCFDHESAHFWQFLGPANSSGYTGPTHFLTERSCLLSRFEELRWAEVQLSDQRSFSRALEVFLKKPKEVSAVIPAQLTQRGEPPEANLL